MIKLSLSETFGTTPVTVSAIIHLVKFTVTDNRLSEREMFSATKSFIIYDSDESIRNLNKEASQCLNERGYVIFHRSLKTLQVRGKISFSTRTVFKDWAAMVYNATSTGDCTFYTEHQTPCYHVMFLRTNYDNIQTTFITFDVSIFHARYFRSREEDIHTSPTSNNGCEEEDIFGNRIEDFESDNNESEY